MLEVSAVRKSISEKVNPYHCRVFIKCSPITLENSYVQHLEQLLQLYYKSQQFVTEFKYDECLNCDKIK